MSTIRVKILSGALAGTYQDLPQVEAEIAIATGYAERAPKPPAPVMVVAPAPETPAERPAAAPQKRRGAEPHAPGRVESP